LQQDGEETRLKIITLLHRPHDAPSTWTDLFRLRVFPDFPEQLDLFEHGESIAHVENPDTFQVGNHNNKQLLFLVAYSALIKEEIPEESVMNHYFNMVNPSDHILFALFQQDYQGYKSQKYPTLSLLQWRCVIREAVSIATVQVTNKPNTMLL
jgi:hypothetical protein